MSFVYEKLVRPVAFLFDAETMHNTALWIGERAGSSRLLGQVAHAIYHRQDPALSVTLGRVKYPSPAGLAAGYDKYGQFIDILPHLSASHEELGTITPYERSGCLKPRSFRLPNDFALITRMGLNNYGLVKTARIIEGRHFKIPLDISFDPNVFFAEETVRDDITRQKMIKARQKLWDIPYAKKINISCPNTEDGRAYESPEMIDRLLKRVDWINQHTRDVYVKFSHDLTNDELGELIDVCNDHDVVGFVIGNTSKGREGLVTPQSELTEIERGGLSGYPLMKRKLEMIEFAREKTDGSKFIVGVGGIGCNPNSTPAHDTCLYLRSGADIVQIFTGIPYRGLGIFKQINQELPDHLSPYGSLEEYRRRRW